MGWEEDLIAELEAKAVNASAVAIAPAPQSAANWEAGLIAELEAKAAAQPSAPPVGAMQTPPPELSAPGFASAPQDHTRVALPPPSAGDPQGVDFEGSGMAQDYVAGLNRYSNLNPQDIGRVAGHYEENPVDAPPVPTADGLPKYEVVLTPPPRVRSPTEVSTFDVSSNVDANGVPTVGGVERYVKKMDAETYNNFYGYGKRLLAMFGEPTPEVLSKLSTEEQAAIINAQFNAKSGTAMAAAEGVGRSIPGSRLVIPESAAERARADEHIVANVVGGVAGNVAGALVGGPVVGKGLQLAGRGAAAALNKIPAASKAGQALLGAGKAGVRVANSAVAQSAATRGLVQAGLSVGQDIGRVDAEGKPITLKEMAINAGIGAAGGVVSMIPEIAAPPGVWQVLLQPGTDAAFDVLLAKARGQDWNQEDWLREIVSLGVSAGFGIRDAVSTKTFVPMQAQQRSEIRAAVGKAKNWLHNVEREGRRTGKPPKFTIIYGQPEERPSTWDGAEPSADMYTRSGRTEAAEAEARQEAQAAREIGLRQKEAAEADAAKRERQRSLADKEAARIEQARAREAERAEAEEAKRRPYELAEKEAARIARARGETPPETPEALPPLKLKPSNEVDPEAIRRDMAWGWGQEKTTPPETQGNTPKSTPDAEAGEVPARPEDSVQREATQAQEGKPDPATDTHWEWRGANPDAPKPEQTPYQKIYNYVIDKYGDMSALDFEKKFMVPSTQLVLQNHWSGLSEFGVDMYYDNPNNDGLNLIKLKKPIATDEDLIAYILDRAEMDDSNSDDVKKVRDYVESLRNKKMSDLIAEDAGNHFSYFEEYAHNGVLDMFKNAYEKRYGKPWAAQKTQKTETARPETTQPTAGITEADVVNVKRSKDGNTTMTAAGRTFFHNLVDKSLYEVVGKKRVLVQDNVPYVDVHKTIAAHLNKGDGVASKILMRGAEDIIEAVRSRRALPSALSRKGIKVDGDIVTVDGTPVGRIVRNGKEADVELHWAIDEAIEAIKSVPEADYRLQYEDRALFEKLTEPTTEPSTKPAENSVREDAPPTAEPSAKPKTKAEIRAENRERNKAAKLTARTDVEEAKAKRAAARKAKRGETAEPKPAPEADAAPESIMMPVALNDVRLNPKISKSGQRQYTVTQIDGKGKAAVRQFVYDPNKTGHLYEIVDGKPKDGKPIYENPNETDVRHIVQAYTNGETLTKFKHFEDSEWVSTSMRGKDEWVRVGKGGGDEHFALDVFDTDVSSGADNARPADAPTTNSGLYRIETPEMVGLFKSVMDGATPHIRRKLRRNALGMAKRSKKTGKASAELKADIFKDPELAARVMAHELGHLDHKNGGELGAIIENVKDGLGKIVEGSPDAAKIRDELSALSKEWRPPEDNATAKDKAYRQSPEEIYADAVSVLLRDPDLLMQRAPTAFKAIMDGMRNKPDFYKPYQDIMSMYVMGDKNVQAHRAAQIKAGFDKATAEKNAAEQKKLETREAIDKHLGLFDKIKEELLDEYTRIAKVGGANNAAYLKLRGLAYTDGRVKVYLKDIDNKMKNIFGKKGFDDAARENLGKYMLYNRVATERADFANPHGLDKATAIEQLNHLKNELGAEAFVKLADAAEAYTKIREEYILPYLFSDDTYGAALKDYALNNPNYATFDVVGHIDKAFESGQSGSLGIHKQVGTLGDVGNPFDATITNDLKLIALKANNDATRAVIDMLETNEHPYQFRKSQEVDLKDGGKMFVEAKGDMRTVKFVKDGELHAYDISSEIADVLIHDPVRIAGPLNTISLWNRFQKDVFVKYNIPFLLRNPFRDAAGTIKNIPKANIRKFLRYFPGALGDTFKMLTTGEMSADLKNAYLEGALHPGRSYDNIKTTDADSFDRFMGQFDEARQVEYSKNIATRALKGLWSAFKAPFEFVGSLEETAGKLTGYKIMAHDKAAAKHIAAKAAKAGVSVEEMRAQMTRTSAGTPDFTHGGKQKRLLNNLFFFSNVNLQGARAGLASFSQNPGAWTTKFMLHTLPWKVVAAYASEERLTKAVEALLGGNAPTWLINYTKFLDESMPRIPEDHRARFFTVPLPLRSAAPTDDEGTPIENHKNIRQLYARVPGDYTTQVAGASAYYITKAIVQAEKAAEKKREKEEAGEAILPSDEGPGALNTALTVGGELAELLPVSGSAVNPMGQVLFAWLDYIGGGQPRDAFTGRDVVPPNMQKAGAGRQLGAMGRWTFDKAGPLSGFQRIYDPNENPIKEARRARKEAMEEDPDLDIPEPVDDRPTLEKVLGYPVVGTAGKAFLGMTNYGLAEKKRKDAENTVAKKFEARVKRLNRRTGGGGSGGSDDESD